MKIATLSVVSVCMLFVSPHGASATYDSNGVAETKVYGIQQITTMVDEEYNLGFRLQGQSSQGQRFEAKYGGSIVYGTMSNGSGTAAYNNALTNEWDSLIFSSSGEPLPSDDVSMMLDLHWGLQKTVEFFHLLGDVHVGQGELPVQGNIYTYSCNRYGQAFPSTNVICFGDDYGNTLPQPVIDVIGHEVTHLVYSAKDLSGGVGPGFYEGLTDLFGVAIKRHFLPESTYVFGEDRIDGGIAYTCGTESQRIRDLSQPVVSTYKGPSWDANINCAYAVGSLINFWYYLLSEGGEGVNEHGDSYSVTGFGENFTGAYIAYQTFERFPSQDYMDLPNYAELSIPIAEELAGPTGKATICDAWFAVGIEAVACTD